MLITLKIFWRLRLRFKFRLFLFKYWCILNLNLFFFVFISFIALYNALCTHIKILIWIWIFCFQVCIKTIIIVLYFILIGLIVDERDVEILKFYQSFMIYIWYDLFLLHYRSYFPLFYFYFYFIFYFLCLLCFILLLFKTRNL